jgi:hypothetical protein
MTALAQLLVAGALVATASSTAPASSRRSCSGPALAHVDDRTLTGAAG